MAGSLHRLPVTALIGALAAAVAAAAVAQHQRPVMNGGDNVQPERYHVQWFVLAGVALLLLAVSVALAFGRDAHGWLWAHGDLLEQLLRPGAGRGCCRRCSPGSCWRSPHVSSA